jgi:hypothetical protein
MTDMTTVWQADPTVLAVPLLVQGRDTTVTKSTSSLARVVCPLVEIMLSLMVPKANGRLKKETSTYILVASFSSSKDLAAPLEDKQNLHWDIRN